MTPVPADNRDRIEALLREHDPDPDAWIARLRGLGSAQDGVCSEAVRLLVNLDLDEDDAVAFLGAVARHRRDWTGRIGRDPGIGVAALDYATRLAPILREPVALERRTLDALIAGSSLDPVSGLRRADVFLDELRRETARCRRRGGRSSLVLLEIDGFRAGVDRYGYRVGHAIIREVAEIVLAATRDSDSAAWLGKGRFGLRLPGTAREGAFAVSERIRDEARKVLADRVEDPEQRGPTLSGGIAVLPEDGETSERLLARAERGLARSRANGGDAISLYHDERRAWIRYPMRPSARVAVTTEDGVSAARSRGLDLSTGGALLETDPAFSTGDRVHVYVKRKDAGRAEEGWSTFASVVRCERRADGVNRLGVRFERPLDDARLHDYVLADRHGAHGTSP